MSTGRIYRQDSTIKVLNKISEGKIYNIELRYHSADPRLELRSNTDLSQAAKEAIKLKLDRLDKYSTQGPWTRMMLQLIRENPQKRAADLSLLIGKEKQWLKLNVRKLKNLGLTISHGVGYSISPLGNTIIEYLDIK